MCRKFILQKFHNTPSGKSPNTTYREKFTLQFSRYTIHAILRNSLITICMAGALCVLVFSLNTTYVCAAETADVGIPQPYDTDSDEYMLQKIAVAEAEGEGVWGQALVMQTVLNRVASPDFPDGVYDVIYQENQFTSISNGRYDKCEPSEASRQAYELLDDMRNDGQTYFEKISPNYTWHSRNLEKVTEYRDHVFYKIPEE